MKNKQTRVIAFVNQKGGVAKTTTTINVGAYLAKQGKKVLLVDCDAQGSLSISVNLGDISNDKSVYELFMGTATVEEVIKTNLCSGFDVAPSDIRLSAADLTLINVMSRETVLKRALEPVLSNYDYVLIDCPPSLGIITLNCLVCASEVLVPMQAQFLALNGIVQLLGTINDVKKILNPGLELDGVLLTMYKNRLTHNKEIMEQVQEFFEDKLFNTKIRDNIAIADAQANGQDIFQYNPHSNGALDYADFTEELIKLRKE